MPRTSFLVKETQKNSNWLIEKKNLKTRQQEENEPELKEKRWRGQRSKVKGWRSVWASKSLTASLRRQTDSGEALQIFFDQGPIKDDYFTFQYYDEIDHSKTFLSLYGKAGLWTQVIRVPDRATATATY